MGTIDTILGFSSGVTVRRVSLVLRTSIARVAYVCDWRVGDLGATSSSQFSDEDEPIEVDAGCVDVTCIKQKTNDCLEIAIRLVYFVQSYQHECL